MISIRAANVDHPAVAALLAYHHAQAHRLFPSEFAHALPPDQLRDPAIGLFAAWEDEALLGLVALKPVAGTHAEVKSMRTHPDHLRRGVARLLLDHVVAEARARGFAQLSLETGTTPDFVAANRLYEQAGFIDAAPFGGYPASPYNRFMTLELTGA